MAGTSTYDAICLLNRLVAPAVGAIPDPGRVAALASADRDRVLAAIYLDTYGDTVRSSVQCPGCEALFDIDFSLQELMASLGMASFDGRDAGLHGADAPEPSSGDAKGQNVRPGGDGKFVLSDGRRFRLPTGGDELAVAGLPPAEAAAKLLRRCLDSPAAEAAEPDPDGVVQRTMAAVAPLLDATLDACCPECGQHQEIRFEIQHYLLGALLGEHDLLAEEIHMLASAYGWSLREILGLPRSRRRALVRLVDRQRLHLPGGAA